jgi:hypothetical protein
MAIFKCFSLYQFHSFKTYIKVFNLPWIDLWKSEEIRDLVSAVCIWISSFSNSIYWRGCLFSNVCFWLLCQKSDGFSCVDVLLEILFHWWVKVWCASTMLFSLLWLCSTSWR